MHITRSKEVDIAQSVRLVDSDINNKKNQRIKKMLHRLVQGLGGNSITDSH